MQAEELRERQIREVVDFCDSTFSGEPHVICGDLNTFQKLHMTAEQWEAANAHYASMGWPSPPEDSLVIGCLAHRGYVDAYARFKEYVSSSDSSPPLPHPLTCWSQKPLFRLDYFFLSPEADTRDVTAQRIRVVDHRVLDTHASDHFPVVVELDVNQDAVGSPR